jgi:hypothetical protein
MKSLNKRCLREAPDITVTENGAAYVNSRPYKPGGCAVIVSMTALENAA